MRCAVCDAEPVGEDVSDWAEIEVSVRTDGGETTLLVAEWVCPEHAEEALGIIAGAEDRSEGQTH